MLRMWVPCQRVEQPTVVLSKAPGTHFVSNFPVDRDLASKSAGPQTGRRGAIDSGTRSKSSEASPRGSIAEPTFTGMDIVAKVVRGAQIA